MYHIKVLRKGLLDAFVMKIIPIRIKMQYFCPLSPFLTWFFYKLILDGKSRAHEKLIIYCLITNFLNFNVKKSELWLGLTFDQFRALGLSSLNRGGIWQNRLRHLQGVYPPVDNFDFGSVLGWYVRRVCVDTITEQLEYGKVIGVFKPLSQVLKWTQVSELVLQLAITTNFIDTRHRRCYQYCKTC